jgi:hypothetical protein
MFDARDFILSNFTVEHICCINSVVPAF